MEEEEDATAAASPKDPAQMPPSPLQPPEASIAQLWAVGSRLESKARDSNGGEQWFPAKVLEVEADKILVHYMQWNARHDEWIPSNSPRLRPLPGSGKSSRHNSGGGVGGNSENEPLVSAASLPTLPAHKDFKPGDKVMATWKLNRKYLASVIRFETSDGTYLVEFYDGVQCRVKPNNMRRPRKGEEDTESLSVNGAIDNGSAENSDNESDLSSNPASSKRRERKRKFDVKQLLNIRSVKSLQRGGSKDSVDDVPSSTGSHNKRETKRRRSRLSASKTEVENVAAENVVNGNGKTRAKSLSIEDGPAMAAVSGKRERKKKKFWDDEQEESSQNNTPVPSTAATTALVQSPLSSGKSAKDSLSNLSQTSSTISPTAVSATGLKRKSTGSVTAPNKKIAKRNDMTSNHGGRVNEQIRPNGSMPPSLPPQESRAEIAGKENGKLLPYLQLDLTSDPELVAEQMIEGVNIPGMGQPIPVDSSSLPVGWEKRVIQRRIGITKGKWDVFITNPETGKSFRSKTELQKHLDERKLPYTCDAFDFSLDDNLKRLRQIWKQYKVKPFLNNPKGSSPGNFKHVPAKITQVQDSDFTHHRSSASSASTTTTTACSAQVATPPPHVPVPPQSSGGGGSGSNHKTNSTNSLNINNGNAADHIDMACLTDIAVESETGQGLRCSIAKCGKLFRNDRLLRQHVKHYHPKVYETVLFKHPQLGDDISEPTSPEPRRLSDSSDFYHEAGGGGGSSERRRMPSSDGGPTKRASFPYDEDTLDQNRLKRGPGRPLKRSLLDEEAPLSNMYNDQDTDSNAGLEPRGGGGSDDFLCRRTRNDSVLSSLNSDTEDHLSSGGNGGSIIGGGLSEHHRNSCPPTPPTFRLSKRRQAQMLKKRVQQPVVRMSKIEDTPLGRDYRDEILSLQANSCSSTALGPTLSSHTTSPNNVNIDAAGNASISSYPPSEMDASIAGSEHLTSEELVNCTCRRIEEDGLMIQCDICLCWQHGYCVGIDDEDPVPEKHVCETCRQPPGGRSEARFSLDQDWLKEGKLPSCESAVEGFVSKTSSRSWTTNPLTDDRETAFRKLSELMADLANLEKLLQSLRLKLHVASQSNNSKVFMWSSVWSLPTHQPQFHLDDMDVDEEIDEEDRLVLKKEPTDEEDLLVEESQCQNLKSIKCSDHSRLGSAIDPQEVAEKLSLIVAENAIKEKQELLDYNTVTDEGVEAVVKTEKESPKENGISRDECHEDQDKKLMENSIAHNDENPTAIITSQDPDEAANQPQQERQPNCVQDITASKVASEDQSCGHVDETSVKKEQPQTLEVNGNDDNEGETESPVVPSPPPTEATTAVAVTNAAEKSRQNGPNAVESDGHQFDTSFIPSVSEVERLLPGVIQEIESGKDSAASSPPTSVAPLTNGKGPSTSSSIIPMPKRLDRDECRLNLLQHIDSVQNEIHKRFKAIESVVCKLESNNTCASTSDANSKFKAKLTMLLQDLSISRQLMWNL